MRYFWIFYAKRRKNDFFCENTSRILTNTAHAVSVGARPITGASAVRTFFGGVTCSVFISAGHFTRHIWEFDHLENSH